MIYEGKLLMFNKKTPKEKTDKSGLDFINNLLKTIIIFIIIIPFKFKRKNTITHQWRHFTNRSINSTIENL